MEITGWITLAAVIVALGLGLSSLIQTHKLQKRERKERLLNEIIEWAADVIKCRFEDKSKSMLSSKNISETLSSFWRYITDIQDNLKIQHAKGFYISKISPIFGQHINESVDSLIKVISDFIDLFDKPKTDMEDILTEQIKLSEEEIERMNNYIEKIDNIRKLLDKSANKVIEEAVKIKTRDIG